jgi:protein tyrosine phosphatase (PTP) superfamily phosphohydrolase (DUF442 family)
MALENIKNFKSVDASLGTAGQPTEAQMLEIASSGYEVVINLGLLDPKYCLTDEAGLVSSAGMEYHHIPVVFTSPQTADFERFVQVMESCRGRKTFVHCALNWRVSVFVGLYGEQYLGWSRATAESLMTTFWNLDEVWTAFAAQCRVKVTAANR